MATKRKDEQQKDKSQKDKPQKNEQQATLFFKKFPSLAAQFPPVSSEAWQQQIDSDLKGADYEKSLFWESAEGLRLAPYYRSEHLQSLLHLNSFPGQFPYLRGRNHSANQCDILQKIGSDDFWQGLREIEYLLTSGVDGLIIPLSVKEIQSAKPVAARQSGLPAQSAQSTQSELAAQLSRRQPSLPIRSSDEMRNLLNSLVDLLAERDFFFQFQAGETTANLLRLFCQLLPQMDLSGNRVGFAIENDPFSLWLTSGSMPTSRQQFWVECAKTIDICAESNTPIYCLQVSGVTFRNAGAAPLQELAFSLAAAAEYLAQLSEHIDVETVASHLFFTVGIGSDYFLEIARLRALPLLWSRIVAQFLPQARRLQLKQLPPPRIHAESISYNKTLYDSYTNILRAVMEHNAALLGGADAFTSLPFELAEKGGDKTSRQISVNLERHLQLISRHEAFLERVVDPTAGSYYIENLTDQVARKVWSLFQKIEKQKGFLALLQSGWIKEQIDISHFKSEQAAAKRANVYLGANHYPNLSERLWESLCRAGYFTSSSSSSSASSSASSSLSSPEERGNSTATLASPTFQRLEPLPPRRAASAFERLRLATERHAAMTGRLPAVFLFAFGNLAMRRARVNFALNFFGCAGYAIADQSGFDTMEEGLSAALASGADIVVFCSSDQDYAAEEGKKLIAAMKHFRQLDKAPLLVMACSPQVLSSQLQLTDEKRVTKEQRGKTIKTDREREAMEQFLKEAIYGFIHKDSNLLSELRRYQNHFGIEEKELCDPLLQI